MKFRKKKNKTDKLDYKQVSVKSKGAFDWLIEFCKKVVFGAFIVYLASTVVIAIYIYFSFSLCGDSSALTTFISETNSTFRIVVGSYCIKAALENIIKIGGGVARDLTKINTKVIKHKISEETGINFDDDNNEDNDDEIEFDSGEDCTGGEEILDSDDVNNIIYG